MWSWAHGDDNYTSQLGRLILKCVYLNGVGWIVELFVEKVRAKRRRHALIRAHLDQMLEEGKVFDIDKDGKIPFQMCVHDFDMH
jgi:hypothetical protein